MPRTPENIHRHELIGLEAEVTQHSDPSLEGINGKVVDETQGLLVIQDKKVSKKNAVFIFTLPSQEKVKVKGEVILHRPEDRVKK